MSKQYVIFTLSDKNFAIKIDQIIEIINFNNVFKVPNTPPYIEGLINLRDTIYTILNLKEMLSLHKQETDFNKDDWYQEESKILLININSRLIGIIVDSVDKIMVLESEKILPPSEFDSQFDSCYLEGIAKMENDNLLLLLDANALIKKIIDKQINCSVW